MITDSYIFLEDLRLFARHGVAEQEREVGNEYRVDVRLRTDIGRAARTDDVADTVNYAEVFNLIRREMDTPSGLLEHVARRMVDAILSHFQTVTEVRLTLRKRNPPMGADCLWAGVELTVQREGSAEKDFRPRT